METDGQEVFFDGRCFWRGKTCHIHQHLYIIYVRLKKGFVLCFFASFALCTYIIIRDFRREQQQAKLINIQCQMP